MSKAHFTSLGPLWALKLASAEAEKFCEKPIQKLDYKALEKSE